MPAGTKRTAETATAEEAKRYKSAIDEMAEEFICPITQELPLDPCIAEDGRIYERAAIESWMQQRAGQELKSPVTNETMGRKLLPAVHAKNSIRSMVKSGGISGAKAEAWQKRLADEEELAKLRRLATDGSDEQAMVDAMVSLGFCYRDGTHGLAMDKKQAFEWMQKAADLDDPCAMCDVGQSLVKGREGVAEDRDAGIFYLGCAAGKGVEHTFYAMGYYYQHGIYGFRKDAQAARKWYLKMDTAPIRCSTQSARDKVAEFLRNNA